MKKIFNVSLTAISMIISMFVFLSCEKDTKEINAKNFMANPSQRLDFNSYANYGVIHNAFLDYYQTNFKENDNVSTIEEGLDYLSALGKNYASTLSGISTLSRNSLIDGIDKYKNFFFTQNLYNEVYNFKNVENTIFDLFEKNIIDDFEKDNLLKIIELGDENFEGKLPIADYQQELLTIKKEWLSQNYQESGNYGKTLAIVLNIGLFSAEWWLKSYEGDEKLPPVVATDAVGALVGATVSGVSSYLQTGHVNWTSVGVGAVSGAVTGSTGVVGKVGKWLAKVL